MNNYQEYMEKQMLDPEFRVNYAFAREKVKLEIYMERLKNDIQNDTDKKLIIRKLNFISKYIKHIAL